MRFIGKTRRLIASRKAASTALAILLVASLSFGMMPLAAYADSTAEAMLGSTSASAASVAATEDSSNATSPNGGDRPLKLQRGASDGVVETEPQILPDILGIVGAEAYARWLEGKNLTADELSSIDVELLQQIDPEAAKAIAELQYAVSASDGTSAPASNASVRPSESSAEADSGGTSGKVVASGQSGQVEQEPIEAMPQGAPEESSSDDDGGVAVELPEWSYSGDTTYTPRNLGVSLTTTKFIAVIGEPARKLAAENDLYASVMIAQAILESASGNSGLASAPYFNLFGIKGSYRGQSVTMSTQEDDGSGSYYTIDAAFRSYPSYRESLSDYVDLLSTEYYAPAHKSRTASFVDACDYLQGTYATSTSYSASLQDLIDTYDLTRYDEPLGYEPAQTIMVQVEDEAASLLAGESVTVTEKRDLVDLVVESTSHLGCPYTWGASGPDEFDCSGLVWSSYREALGLSLPRVAADQALVGQDVDFADLHMGDLLFFTDSEGHVNHAAMYLAEGCYIESTTPGGVQVTSMEEHMPVLAKRVVETSEAGVTTATVRSSLAKDRWSNDEEELRLYAMYLGL